MTTITVRRQCRVCSTTHTLELDSDSYRKWLAGALIQDVFPDLSDANREILISGTCDPCFHKLYDDEEEERDLYEESLDLADKQLHRLREDEPAQA